jgi:UDP:flavonoid glycosyltransferase YjiC (YdhE family)
MRILFTSSPGIGHAFPMVPLAWALRTAGHDVLLATAGQAMAVEHAGLAVADVAPGYRLPQDALERLRASAHQIGDSQTVQPPAELFARMSASLIDLAVELARAWRPDLVISSQLDGAGLVVAGALQVPLVSHRFGFVRSEALLRDYHELLADEFRRHGVDRAPLPDATIDVAPPSMAVRPGAEEAAGPVWPMRYIPYNGSGRFQPWQSRPPTLRRQRIAVTLGTVAPSVTGTDVVGRIIAAAAGLDVELVLALGDDIDLTALGPLPQSVRTTGWMPLNTLLPSCAALIHHGGAGTALAALDAGVPQLILPNGADRFLNADVVSRRGAGLRAHDTEIDTELLEHLLRDEHLRATAAEVRTEIQTMPPPAHLVTRITELATPTTPPPGAAARTT